MDPNQAQLSYMPAETPDGDEAEGVDYAAVAESMGAPFKGLPIENLKGFWGEASSDYAEARILAQVDRDYYDGKQWSKTELEKLARRKQAPTVFNIVQRKIDAIVGVEIRTRSEPRCYPRNPADADAAEIATDVLRYVKEKERWNTVKTNGFLDGLVEGACAIEIGGEKSAVPMTPIHASEFFWDPRSRKYDFSDARYMGTAKWVDIELAIRAFASPPPMPTLEEIQEDPRLAIQYHRDKVASDKAQESIRQTLDQSLSTTEFEDRPFQIFGDKKRNRVFVVDMWYLNPESGWARCVFTGQGKLYECQAEHNHEDGEGRKTHPIVAFSPYVDRDNCRYGPVRQLRPVQDEINKRRSKALHILTANQIIMEPGAAIDGNDNKLRAEAQKPDGVMSIRAGARFEIVKNVDLASGQMQMDEAAMAFAERLGPNPQLMGQQGQASSGRAILALQQSGLGELGVVFDRLRDWELRVYRTIWTRVRQYWDGPSYVRVTDDTGAARFSPINGAPKIGDDGKPMVHMAPDGKPMMQIGAHPITGAMTQTPAIQTGPALADLDIDIIIDAAPEAASLQAEQFEQVMKMVQAGALQLPPEAVIELSTLPNKSIVRDLIKKASSETPNPAQQMAMQKMEGEIKGLHAKVAQMFEAIEKSKADRALVMAQTAKTLAEASAVGADGKTEAVEALAELGILTAPPGNLSQPSPGMATPGGGPQPALPAPPNGSPLAAPGGQPGSGPPSGGLTAPPDSPDVPNAPNIPLAAGGPSLGAGALAAGA